MLQNIRLQNSSVSLSSPANSVTQSNHYVNGGGYNGLGQLSEIVSQSTSKNYGSVGEQYTTPHEIKENGMDEKLLRK